MSAGRAQVVGMTCLACGSGKTERRGRVLHCRSCETAYFIPARLLIAASRSSVLSRPVGVPADAVDGNPPREGYSTGPVPLHDAEYDPATGMHTCTSRCPSCAAITTKHGPK